MYNNIHYKYYTYTLTESHHWHIAQHPNYPINIMEGTVTREETMVLEAMEDVVGNIEETGEGVMEAVDPVALITTSVHMVCVTTKASIVGPSIWPPKYCDRY